MIAVPTNSTRAAVSRLVGDVAAVLDFIDELEDGATGNVIFVGTQGAATGAAFVENGRVCWAAAQGLARRLTTLLVERSKGALDRDRVESLVHECRTTGRPIGERLVELGLLEPEGLRAALREHTVESLGTLIERGAMLRWVRRSVGGYSPRYTFSTGELSAALGVSVHPDAARRAEALCTRIADADDPVVVFKSGLGALSPVFVAGGLSMPAWELAELARGLSLTSQIASALEGSMRMMTFASRSGGGVAVLRSDDLLVCVMPAEARAMARVLSRFTGEISKQGGG